MNNEKNIKIILILMVAGIFVIGQYLLFLQYDWLTRDNPYGSFDDELLGFYDKIPEKSILFIGTSQFKAGVNATQIEEELRTQNISNPVFNLAKDGDSFFKRLIELQRIIDRHPSLVIISSTWFQYGYNGQNDENSMDYISKHYYDLNPDLRELLLINETLSPNQIKKLQPDFFGKRITIKENIICTINPLKSYTFNFKNYPPYIPKKEEEIVQRVNEIRINYPMIEEKIRMGEINDIREFDMKNATLRDYYGYYIPKDSVQIEAFRIMIKNFHENNIPVIVIHMPLGQEISNFISDETRYRYFEILNSTGVENLDYERKYPELMADFNHLDANGKKAFSHDMVSLIVENGVE